MELLFDLLYGVCAQRPEHSLFIAGAQLPLEARMGGLFAGFLIGLAYFALLGRLRAASFPTGALGGVLLAFILMMSADGLNAFLFDRGWLHLYEPSNLVRLASGLLCGLGLAAFALPSAASVFWKEVDWDAPLRTWGELGGALAVLALFGMLLLADLPYLLYPVALIFAASVVCALTLANLYFVGLVRSLAVENLRHGLAPLALGLGLTMAELAGLALLRDFLAASYGIEWIF